MSTEAQATYKSLLARMLKLREENQTQDSTEEDALLDQMDAAWWDMTEDEQEQVELWVAEFHPEEAYSLD
jgi:hypothetical protein